MQTALRPAADACFDTAERPASPRALALANAALQEHAAWGSQALDAHGRMTESGSSEAEDTPRTQGLAPWERVMRYWQAVDPATHRLPWSVRYGALRPADRTLLKSRIDQASSARLQGMGVGPDQGLPSDAAAALAVAVDRVAAVDTPWSAAFISWLARQAGLTDGEFAFSEAHADYAAAGWSATRRERAGLPVSDAMRACDLATTPPRVGDLVCQARGAAGDALDSFGALVEALSERGTDGGALPMHCDAVVSIDATGFDAVGGNVLQSVTRRRLDFAPGTRRLDASYLSNGCVPGTPDCPDRHMSRQPWSLLLQWR
ncbi:MAG: DUF2272 domain-containing protein [Comamonadaceae bacterium]|nr:MAG: DUF2272 domain-containing protein [Comamonadaceae bacterium]